MTITELISSNRDEDPMDVHLVTGEGQDGKQMYHFVAVRRSRLAEMTASLDSKVTNLEDYGVIVGSGTGKPSKFVREYVLKKIAEG